MRLNHLAVVMPAYNEAVGIPGFVREVHTSLAPLAERLDIVVVNDRSTDATAEVLTELSAEMPGLRVITAEQNRGHGPTALAAYRAGLELEPDLLVHVDGDGQFHGDDLARLVTATVDTGADVVHGVRTGRTDPWFRRALTGFVGALVAVAARRRIPDVNTPLRAYRPAVSVRSSPQCPSTHMCRTCTSRSPKRDEATRCATCGWRAFRVAAATSRAPCGVRAAHRSVSRCCLRSGCASSFARRQSSCGRCH